MQGRILSHYEIIEPLGAGGMGEVYRARDTKLKRDVAIKVLPEDFAADQDRLARFEREAKVLASLNHANIAAIYGLEDYDDVRFIVMELVEGETLADRVSAAGRIEVDEALEIARQIAEALEAAHESGVVHRDLKPANVEVTPEGRVKVLDFGLAKAYEADGSPAEISPDLSQSPTMAAATRTGVILGTAAYMSPEQARGKPVDRRTDIWAFGCVLYEMLTGRKPFEGETATDIIAAIVEREPDWSALPHATPPSVRRLLRRSLRKDLARRLHHVGDALLEIDERNDESVAVESASSPRWGMVAAMIVAVVAVGWALAERFSTAPEDVSTAPAPGLELVLPTRVPPNTAAIEPRLSPLVAIAPDASRIVYAARDGESSLLYEYPLDGGEIRPIAGTQGARSPFFSPDSESIGFVAGGRIQTLPRGGSVAREVGPADGRSGIVWMPSGTLLSRVSDGITRYELTGEAVRLLSPGTGIGRYSWPVLLPGEEHLIVATQAVGETNLDDPSEIRIVSLADGSSQLLVSRGSTPDFLPSSPGARTGYLLYALEGTIWAAPFDAEARDLLGPAVAAVSGVMMRPNGDAAQYAVAADGTLVYLSGTPGNELVWVDAAGIVRPASSHRRPFAMPRLSPDGRRVALEMHEGTHAIWVLGLESDALGRFSYDEVHNFAWGPDSQSLLYTGSTGSTEVVMWKRVGTPGPGEVVLADDSKELWVDSWSDDGRFAGLSAGLEDVWLLPLTPGEPPTVAGELIPIAVSRFTERDAMVSPDGNCIAYSSDETGRPEIYVSCPATNERIQVSSTGAGEPVWSRDGATLYFRTENRLLGTHIEREPLQADRPVELHSGAFLEFDPANFDVAADGERFLRLRSAHTGGLSDQLMIRFGWQRELERLTLPDNRH